jgi:SAM-dependent methyltransferase
MAITHVEYALIRRLKEQSALPENPSVLELGQSNWYGDVPLDTLVQDIRRFVSPAQDAEALVNRLANLAQAQDGNWLFDIADIFWQVFLGPDTYAAIDMDGVDARAHKFDLNEPVPLKEQFDVVCNFGTAEHVFNVYQVFKTIHELTKPGGWMLHGLPFQGWVDHGFYSFHPTFFFDLAETNHYASAVFFYAEVSPLRIVAVKGRDTLHEMVERGEIGANAMLFTAFRRPLGDGPFKAPMQGYYARRLDATSAERWLSLR